QRQQQESAAKRQKKQDQNPFRAMERCFKARSIPADALAKAIHTPQLLQQHHHPLNDAIVPVTLALDIRKSHPGLFGEPDADGAWATRARKAFLIKDVPGLIIIPNPFTDEAQRRLIELCLTDYAKPPNISNLDAHYVRPAAGVWDLYARALRGELTPEDAAYYVSPRQEGAARGASGVKFEDQDDDAGDKSKENRVDPVSLMKKQRWITLGYQYDWQTKVYDLEHGLPMPEVLDELGKAIVGAVNGVGTENWQNRYAGDQFKAEAGVINYYQLRDTLMAHVDKSEVNMDAPLVSASFGHACIYLIGGKTKEVEPIPLCLYSGDIIVMTGPCRKAYHGVPRILEDTLPRHLGKAAWPIFGDYMEQSRINVNVRQVF
ncbi:hypothetical protein BC940DRAFT_211513, partial [Gongronella butleri]